MKAKQLMGVLRKTAWMTRQLEKRLNFVIEVYDTRRTLSFVGRLGGLSPGDQK